MGGSVKEKGLLRSVRRSAGRNGHRQGELVPRARLTYCTREARRADALSGAGRVAARAGNPPNTNPLPGVRARKAAHFSSWRLGIWSVSVRTADRSV